MTNREIIFNTRFELMEAGIIGTTGRKIRVAYTDDNGETMTKVMDEPEEIHTFADWKARGYMVQKGQKARARFTIWNHSDKPRRKAATEEEKQAAAIGEPVDIDSGYFYMKNACFFAASQVAPIAPAEKLLPAICSEKMLPAVVSDLPDLSKDTFCEMLDTIAISRGFDALVDKGDVDGYNEQVERIADELWNIDASGARAVMDWYKLAFAA